MPHFYTPKQASFITNNIKGCSRKELTEMFNDYFKLDLKVSQITAFIKNHGLSNGLDARFKPGHISANKGISGGGWEPTQFKKGNKPHNWVPIGYERVNTDGYTEIKIQDGKLQKNWKGKHIVLWEKENGSVPQGHVVIFGDGNNRNFDINNLLLVSRKQLATLNQKGLIQNDANLTRSAIIMTDIFHKISERKKK